ncbi:hypothetical protein NC653_011834 [Populus alba x Populus x berolinensis]|uniref:Uncharacterized protein n=1 Tax=Populus alba x Populus x berolinensis TaxID=444605 RepID=A0AAD6R349_9ROSI|nr:hypothetical protein NC653_011834 [Populus alba x Populus x berolinensis]
MFGNANSANSPRAISLAASPLPRACLAVVFYLLGILCPRLEIHKKLEKHDGCVNTLSFNAGGDILVSVSDDLRVILWDWETGRDKLSFRSGHANNVFQANFMPFSDDRTIITCAADGEIQGTQISLPFGGMNNFAQLYDIRKYISVDGSSDFGQPLLFLSSAFDW